MAHTRATVERPDGLEYRADFLTETEEEEVLRFLESIDFHEIKMRGQTARRTVRHYGFDYDYEGWTVSRTEPIPAELLSIRERSGSIASIDPDDLVEALVSRYPPGAAIGWHRDAPMFGARVVGVSLLADSRMRFQRTVDGQRRVFDLPLARRSLYVLGGPARSAWQHSIPPVKDLRFSVTFRTLERSARASTP